MSGKDPQGLVCKLCVFDRFAAKLPTNIDEQPRYADDRMLRDHWNHRHREEGMRVWDGTEASWPGIVREARGLAAGFIIACGDGECTHYLLWCLHCDHQTSDPVAVVTQRCPKCGRQYAYPEAVGDPR